jgi:hypothetical protein
MAKTTMVAADVLQQGRRPLKLAVAEPTELMPFDERLFSVLELIERELGDIRNRLVSFDKRFERLQASFMKQAGLVEVLPENAEFLLHVCSAGGYTQETRTGLLPEPGDQVDCAGDAIVLSVGRSPEPADAKPCVYAILL